MPQAHEAHGLRSPRRAESLSDPLCAVVRRRCARITPHKARYEGRPTHKVQLAMSSIPQPRQDPPASARGVGVAGGAQDGVLSSSPRT